MALVTPDTLDDFVTLTLSRFKRRKWTDDSLPYTDYVYYTVFNKKKIVERGGKDISFRVQTKNAGNAKNTGLYAADNIGVEDVMVAANVPWRFQVTGFAYDEREPIFQSDKETIINELVIRDHVAHNDMAELTEKNLWGAPATTTSDEPMGVPFWITKDPDTTPEGDFLGTDPSGWSSSGRAGIKSTDVPRWKNYKFGYTSISPQDAIRKTKKALTFTNFMPPHPHPELGYGRAEYTIFTTYRVLNQLESMADMRNDNHKAELASYMNHVLIGGVPVRYVPYLEDTDTDDPMYGICWRHFRPFVHKNWNMVRKPPQAVSGQHNVRRVFIDNACNFTCERLRTQFVGSLSS